MDKNRCSIVLTLGQDPGLITCLRRGLTAIWDQVRLLQLNHETVNVGMEFWLFDAISVGFSVSNI